MRFDGSMSPSTKRRSAQVRRTTKRRSETPCEARRAELGSAPGADAPIALDLRGAVAGDEVDAVRRSVALVVHVEVRVGADRLVLVGDRRVHPRGQHLRTAGMRRDGHVQIAGRQRQRGLDDPETRCRGDRRLHRLRLVRSHQRAATRVAEEHDSLDPGNLSQPFHSHADVGERVIGEKVGLVATEAGVPPEEAVAALREVAARGSAR